MNDRTGARLVFTPTIANAAAATEGEGVRVAKWPPDPNHVLQENGNDFAYFRLGEIYLIKAEAEFENLTEEEDAVESALGVDHVLEVYAPVLSEDGDVIGAYEIYADSSDLEASIADRKRVIWMATAAVFFALWAMMLLLARTASRTLRRQTTTLRERSLALTESYRLLEESSLEAVESLNATVDAKDPYTAGHSARVQRIALAVANELELSGERLDAVRFGGLFHDIGKIGVRSEVLTKPGALSEVERAHIRSHATVGEQIIAEVDFLQEVRPLIRHHQERYDGSGYPDGLQGEAIPLMARIIAVTDVFDALTTDRPYRRALPAPRAFSLLEEEAGRAFDPRVVEVLCRMLR